MELEFAISPTNKKVNIFDDNIAYVEQYDFSRANISEDSRIHAISGIASICYQNPKALNSSSLYNRLMSESMGLPSSSFEMVPMLFELKFLESCFNNKTITILHSNMLKYGEIVENGRYLLTNYRAVIYDFENHNIDLRKHFNTEEECKIISKHYKVFKFNVDLNTRSQMVRHRVNIQELSRRYVSGKRVPFEFYISEKMKDVRQTLWIDIDGVNQTSQDISTSDLINVCVNHYYKALENGIRPEEARRIIPQAAYTTLWMGFQPTALDNYFNLRLDTHAQWEIRQTAIAMKKLINEVKEADETN